MKKGPSPILLLLGVAALGLAFTQRGRIVGGVKAGAALLKSIAAGVVRQKVPGQKGLVEVLIVKTAAPVDVRAV
jgi:hypothetical protein